jgi:integrase
MSIACYLYRPAPEIDSDGSHPVVVCRGFQSCGVLRSGIFSSLWTVDEAATFLNAAKAAGPQPSAFYTLALDTGARRGGLAALRWSDVDLNAGKLTIRRTLLKAGRSRCWLLIGNIRPRLSCATGSTIRTSASRSRRKGATCTTEPIRSACRSRSTRSAIGSSPG